MNEGAHSSGMRTRRSLGGVGMVLFLAFVASCFAWGPLGIVAYVGGLFNSLSVLALVSPLFLLILVAAGGGLLVLVVDMALPRPGGLKRRIRHPLLTTVCAAVVLSFGLGLAGIVPSCFDMFVRGFARYAEKRADVPAIQDWLSALDPNEYVGTSVGSGGIPISPTEYPRSIVRLRPLRRPHGVRVSRDDTGKLMV